jgi:hypothetical protein
VYFCRTGKDNPPVTFAIAACETQNVNVTVLPAFSLSGENCSSEKCTTAKDMWDKMAQVNILSVSSFSIDYYLFNSESSVRGTVERAAYVNFFY